jgi:hypothetical protein
VITLQILCAVEAAIILFLMSQHMKEKTKRIRLEDRLDKLVGKERHEKG